MPIKKRKREKPALESYDVRKMTLKPASFILSELKHFFGGGGRRGAVKRGSGLGYATWLRGFSKKAFNCLTQAH